MSSSDSPVKSSSSDSRRQTSGTTSIFDISSKTSFSNHSHLDDIKKRVELLKIQLRQREAELEKEKWNKEEQSVEQQRLRSECDKLMSKVSAVRTVCDDLHRFIAECEQEEKKKLTSIEELYKKHFEEISDLCSKLRHENGSLRGKLVSAETKVSSVEHENEFLRWENNNQASELDFLKKTSEEKNKENCELKTEVASLKLNQRQVNKVNSDRIERTLQNMAQTSASQLSKLKLQYDDREREYGITLTRVRNEMDFLKKELERRDSQSVRLTKLLDELTEDNKNMLNVNSELRVIIENEKEKMNEQATVIKNEVQAIRDENVQLKVFVEKMGHGVLEDHDGCRITSAASHARLEAAQSTIRTLRLQIEELKHFQNCSDSELREELQRKCVQFCELREKIRLLEKNCEEEKTQRITSTRMLLEMSEDMRTLLNTMKETERRYKQ